MEMADGYPPYSDMHPIKEFFFTATIGPPPLANPSKWSREFKRFLESCLTLDPAKRGTAEQLLNNPWLRVSTTRKEFADTVPVRMYWT